MLCLFQRNVIGTARQARKSQLGEIILPQADRAAFAAAGLAGEDTIAATGAGKTVWKAEHLSNIAVTAANATPGQ